jgi:hypothetical protein
MFDLIKSKLLGELIEMLFAMSNKRIRCSLTFEVLKNYLTISAN